MRHNAQITRRWWFLASTGAVGALCVAMEELLPRLRSGRLTVSAPGLRLLTGRPLEHLRNGSSLAFDFQLTMLDTERRTVLDRALERFVISYDLWEEKFAVDRQGPKRQYASHLSAAAAENWCLSNVSLGLEGHNPDRDFWLRLEVHVEDPRERPPLVGNQSLNLNSLIELFSRTNREGPADWKRDAGPFRISSLRSLRDSRSS
ncbi:MAG: hypothetical protein NTY38_19440 [Acidobacteria bacterium]|nr:hypothetical protein [Acidobacteriota bacterium]